MPRQPSASEPSPRQSLQATFSRLIARAPEPAPKKLDLHLDLPPREPAAAESSRRDERLKSVFSRLKASRSD